MSVGVLRREIVIKNGRNRKPRPKTFKTKEAAQEHAKKMGYKDYEIVNLKNEESSKKKFKVNPK